MKHLYTTLLLLVAAISLSAQTRLYTIGALELNPYSREVLIKKIMENSHYPWTGFSYNPLYYDVATPPQGFCINYENKSIEYTRRIPPTSYGQEEKYSKTELKVSERNIIRLSRLLRLAVVTSSPQPESLENSGHDVFFTHFKHLAGVDWGERGDPQFELVDICLAVCRACEENNVSYIDSIADRITRLIPMYKQLLNYDFSIENNMLRIGNINGYVYVLADFDTEIDRDKLPEYMAVLESVARYLVENNDGPVQCYLNVKSTVQKDCLKVDNFGGINVGLDDFTQEGVLSTIRNLDKSIFSGD